MRKTRAWLRKYLLLWLPAVLLLLTALLYQPLLTAERFAADHLFWCPFYELTGLYCPFCGGTRSVTALLHGKLLLSLHENPLVLLLLLIVLLFYAERVAAVFERKLRLLPRSNSFWTAVCILQLIWAVLRNFIPFLKPFS